MKVREVHKRTELRYVYLELGTINYGSELLMKIVDIKNEYKDDYTMSLPIQILRVLNADL